MGRGIEIGYGAEVEIHRAVFEQNSDVGIFAASPGTALVLADVIVRDTQCDGNGYSGAGIIVQDEASVDGSRLIIERNHEVGVMAIHEGTSVELSDMAVSYTYARDCVVDICSGQGAGHGVVSRDDAHIDVTGFTISESALCGVQVALGGTMDLHDGIVDGNLIGANVQTDGFDWDQLLDGVTFSNNERDFDSNFMPVPDTALPSDWLIEDH